MSSRNKSSQDIIRGYRYIALGEIEDLLYNTPDNLEEKYCLDLDVHPDQNALNPTSNLNATYNGKWSEVSEEYTADSDSRETKFQVAIRDYYEEPNIPPTLEEKTADEENIREIRLEQVEGNSTLFNLIADELYEELKDAQISYDREESGRIHRFER